MMLFQLHDYPVSNLVVR